MFLEEKIKEFVNNSINEKVFCCVSIGVIFNKKGKRNKTIVCEGRNSDKIKEVINKKTFFDLASLTKPFSVVFSVLSLIKNKKINLNSNIESLFVNKIIDTEKKSIKIEQLLSHSAGFPAHRNYFKELMKVVPEERKEFLFKLLMDEPLVYEPGSKIIYSDLGYMLLGLIIEMVSGEGLDSYLKKMILDPMGLGEHIFYNPIGSTEHRSHEFAAVEYCPWRDRVLAGEVSDENCWAMGGVAGHAGLYGDIHGVTALAELILDLWLGKKDHPNISREDLTLFLRRNSAIKDNTWALGFDTPTPGKSSSGKYLSTVSIGHLGYTGTSFWIDPVRELAVVILSNRVHPRRDNELIKKFRPAFHDMVVEVLGLQSGRG